ncbi:Glycine cleavage system T protein (aminomethyltransferase) [Pseudonocardia ammonioxydans]|uniref:Glycine cleavage system T protein (Aminomethyltransferase) n=1 Tax=Pseudonocardia ammonioxydans TaxID=260086 RepID=A0A1I4T3S3_PSUAM|nr:FAD-dependent oxidoreductase [Pseudonocardia ammonioxydans]SFM71285.1 Glycine cleavage system T protein (aminomethyltransferase) [Pseudonocardia ammonioxydans]
MATSPRIVIIGAGGVGCALADELTRRGHTHVTVLAEGALFAAAPAPEPVLQVSHDPATTRLATATVRVHTRLAAAGVRCLRRVGSLEVATTPARLDDLHRRHGRAAEAGIGSRVLDPGECAAVHPLLDRERILGGLHVPGDGTAAAVTVAGLQARAAIERGATFLDHRPVVAIEQRNGRVTGVRCAGTGEWFPADLVVGCAGLRGPAIGELAGVDLALSPTTRRYRWSAPLRALAMIHALESVSGAGDPSLPVLRQRAAGLYVHADGHRLGVGSGAHPAGTDPSWAAAAELLPVLDGATVADDAESATVTTPDGLPLLGEHPGLGGFWVAEAVRDAHAAGTAEAVAEWIVTGRPASGGTPVDLSGLQVDRFDPASRVLTGRASVTAGRPDRPIRTAPLVSRQAELRAVFAAGRADGRPLWFGANASLPEVCEILPRRGPAAADRSPVAGAEALVTRRAAGMFDLSPLRRVEVAGPRAVEFLQRLVTADVDRPVGRVVHALLLDSAGGVLTDLTVSRLGAQRFLVVLPGPAGVAHLCRYTRDGVAVTDVSDDTACLGVWGPLTAEVLTGLIPDGMHDLGPFRAAGFTVGPVPVTGLRVSAVGEYGWELVCAAADAERLWDTVHAAGARHGLVAAGRDAFESLCREKGRRIVGTDLSPEHGPDAAGLSALVAMDKGPFVGRAAVHAAREAELPAAVLATLVLDHTGAVLGGGEPVRDLPAARRFTREPVPLAELEPGPPEPIGRITDAGIGYTCGVEIARARLPVERAVAGTRVAVEVGGRRLTARVVEGALHDPAGTRMRTPARVHGPAAPPAVAAGAPVESGDAGAA